MITTDKNGFHHMTVETFNKLYCFKATKEMDIREFTDYLEGELSYFYAFFCDQDVLDAIQNELFITKHMEFTYLCIENLFIAIY